MLKKLRAIFTFTGIMLLLGSIFTDEWSSTGERFSYAFMSICILAVCQPSVFFRFLRWLLKGIASIFCKTNNAKPRKHQLSEKKSEYPQTDVRPQKRLNAKQLIEKSKKDAALSAHPNKPELEHSKHDYIHQERITTKQVIEEAKRDAMPAVNAADSAAKIQPSETNHPLNCTESPNPETEQAENLPTSYIEPTEPRVRIYVERCDQSTEEIQSKVKNNEEFAKYGGVKAELLTIDLMSDAEFKKWCAEFLRKSGFSRVEAPSGGSKNGVDYIAEYGGHRHAILCNHSRSDLGSASIQKVFTGKFVYQCDECIVMANQYFKDPAKELAISTGTILCDRETIELYLDGMKIPIVSDKCCPNDQSKDTISTKESNEDPMFPIAVDCVLETGQASVSAVQRKLRLGYARSSSIIDEMEAKGIVGPFDGTKPREILITRAEWEQMREQLSVTLPF